MQFDAKSPAQIVGAVLVAGVFIAGATVGWSPLLESIAGLRTVPEIHVSSPLRSLASDFLADEKLRFSLAGVQPDRVYWLIDETQVVPGGVEIEHVFPYDDSVAVGLARDRRVDVFFKVGDEYRTTAHRVRTINIQWNAVAHIESDSIFLEAARQVAGGWQLTSGSLAAYHDGVFTDNAAFALTDSSVAQSALNLRSFVAAPGVRDPSLQWVSLRYRNLRSNELVNVIQRLRN